MAEIFTSVKSRDKISHKTVERPRMSVDKVGEGILILLDGKSGNIEGYYYDFVMKRRSMSDNIFCYWSTQNKKSDIFVCVVTKRRSVYRGSL